MRTVAKKTRHIAGELREGKVSELIKSKLDQYDYLVQQHYMNPISKELMEIVCTFYSREEDMIIARSRPIIDEIELDNLGIIDDEVFEYIPVDGEDGAVALVELFNSGIDDVNQPWPQNKAEWLVEQQKDDTLRVPFERLITEQLCIPDRRAGTIRMQVLNLQRQQH